MKNYQQMTMQPLLICFFLEFRLCSVLVIYEHTVIISLNLKFTSVLVNMVIINFY
jgi:hypothetical protein